MMIEQFSKKDQVHSVLLFVIQLSLFVFSIIYAKERILFADTAIFLGLLIEQANFFVVHNRFIAIFSQFLPLIGIELGSSVSSILVLYSINIQLLYFLTFLLLFKKKNLNVAIAFTIFQISTTLHSYYLPISELGLGICFLFLIYSSKLNLFNTDKHSIYKLTCLFILSVIIGFSHPLIISTILLAYICFIFDIVKPKNTNNRAAHFFFLSSLVMSTISLIFFTSGHESSYMQHTLGNLFNIDIMQSRIKSILAIVFQYYVAWLIIGIILSLLIFKRKFLSATLFTLFILGTFTLYFFNSIYFNRHFFEIHQLGIPFAMSIFFIYCIQLSNTNQALILRTVIILLLLIQTFQILNSSNYYTERIKLYACVIEEMKAKNVEKALFSYDGKYGPKIDLEYANGYESVILSNCLYKETLTFNFIRADKEQIDNLIHNSVPVPFNYPKNDRNDKFYEACKNPSNQYFKMSDAAYQTFELNCTN